MKTHIILIVSLFSLLFAGNLISRETSDPLLSKQDSTIKISCPAEVYPLVVKWTEEYTRTHPEQYIEVDMLSETSNEDILFENSGIISSGNLFKPDQNTTWSLTLGNDVYVPVISEQNPFIEELNKKGVRAADLAMLFSENELKKWGTLLGNETDIPVHVYMVDGESAARSIGNFLDEEASSFRGINRLPENEILNALRQDPYAIAFCRLENLQEQTNQTLKEGVCLLPIDKNGNGKLDYIENCYADFNSVARGIWIGKYPKELVNRIYFSAASAPKNENEVAFLKWILTNGQPYLSQFGYNKLINSASLSQLEKLVPVTHPIAPSGGMSPLRNPGLYILVGIAILILVLILIFGRTRIKKTNIIRLSPDKHATLFEKSIKAPGGLYYDRNHTWTFMEKDGTVKVGVDDFLQHVVGQVTRIKMKIKGEVITKGEPLLSIVQKGKQLTIYAPITGIITEINEQLLKDTSLINASPYDEGWIYQIEPDNWSLEFTTLKTATKYKQWLSQEFTRLKDFLVVALTDKQIDMSMIVLQDGGSIRDNIMDEMSPEIWEDFQTYFLDLSK